MEEEARAIHAEGPGFVAGVGHHTARFDAEGVTVTDPSSGQAVLSVRTVAWGRADTPVPVEAREALLGDCTGVGPATGDCERQLEYVDVGFSEWWRGLRAGLEQGWTVDAPPDGTGPLIIDVEIIGDPGQWTVAPVTATDADGLDVPARGGWTDEGLHILVDDSNARYPVSVDPVYSEAATVLTGETSGDAFGGELASAGDVNGDGFADVVVGAMHFNGSQGRVYLFLGSASGLASTPSQTLTGASSGDAFGTVAGAGDVNGDGYDDVIVGAYAFNSYQGRAYIYLGSASGLSATPSVALTGQSVEDYFGLSVAGAGDTNGDGYADVVVGACLAGSGGTGAAYVYLGSAGGIASTASRSLIGEYGEVFGNSVSGAGDVDGDGYDDVIVGATNADSNTGRAAVFLGSASGIPATAAVVLYGAEAGDFFGYPVVRAGDVNGDGFDDVMIGQWGGYGGLGQMFVHAGSPDGLEPTPMATLVGTYGGDNPVMGASAAGDVNGDGYGDILTGVAGADSGTGAASLYIGSSRGISLSAATTLTGESVSDWFGGTVSGAGDVDGDGYDDILVGALGYGDGAGRAYLYRGYGEFDLDGDGHPASTDCDDDDPDVHVGGREIAGDGIDQDCTGTELCFADSDRDGYRTLTLIPATDLTCTAPGLATVSTPRGDCDDSDSAVHHGALEVCNGVDDDCDGVVDLGAADAAAWYADADGDGWGARPGRRSCATPAGSVLRPGDCNDDDDAIHPGGREVSADGIDGNCNGYDGF